MRPCSGSTSWKETEIGTQKIKDRPMANKKYDYSEDIQQSTETTTEMAEASAEEVRRQRLEQRNDALVSEFRKLKPEIADAHRQLNKLIEGIGAYAGTIQNLHDLLKASFPIRFTESDKLALLKEISAIANNAISQIHNEREKASKDIHRNDNRISITQATFWCLIVLLLILATFFVLVIFANIKLLHSEMLTQISVIYSALAILTIGIITYIYKRK